MRRQAYITSIFDGQLYQPIDLGNFSWRISIEDSEMNTTKNKDVGVDEVSSVDVPWAAVPGNTQTERANSIMPGRRGIAVFDQSDEDVELGRLGNPMMWGGIVSRTSDWESTSLTVEGIYQMAERRFAIREGDFQDNRSYGSVNFSGMTMRGIACEVLQLAMNKPGGLWPLDLPYLGERHARQGNENANTHQRNYEAWNVANISAKDILDKLAGVLDGVDMQFRPYLTPDRQKVRISFYAAPDGVTYFNTPAPFTFICHDGYGNLENLHVDYSMPYQRVYATGAGEDREVLTAFVQDLSMVDRQGSMSLNETSMSDSDDDKLYLLKRDAQSRLDSLKTPIMQFSGEFDENDPGTPNLATTHTGEECYIDIGGYPDIPDGVYKTRILEFSGDSSSRVKVVFDSIPAPYF